MDVHSLYQCRHCPGNCPVDLAVPGKALLTAAIVGGYGAGTDLLVLTVE